MSKQSHKPDGYLDGQEIDRIERTAHLLRGQAFADTFNFLFRRTRTQ